MAACLRRNCRRTMIFVFIVLILAVVVFFAVRNG